MSRGGQPGQGHLPDVPDDVINVHPVSFDGGRAPPSAHGLIQPSGQTLLQRLVARRLVGRVLAVFGQGFVDPFLGFRFPLERLRPGFPLPSLSGSGYLTTPCQRLVFVSGCDRTKPVGLRGRFMGSSSAVAQLSVNFLVPIQGMLF